MGTRRWIHDLAVWSPARLVYRPALSGLPAPLTNNQDMRRARQGLYSLITIHDDGMCEMAALPCQVQVLTLRFSNTFWAIARHGRLDEEHQAAIISATGLVSLKSLSDTYSVNACLGLWACIIRREHEINRTANAIRPQSNGHEHQ